MPLTLEQAKVTQQDKIVQNVIDEFRRSSVLLDSLTFDDTVSPGTGGSTLTYAYTRLKSPSTAGPRAINQEYTPGEALREKASADLQIFGGSFAIDRVIAKTSGALNEVAFQLSEKVKAARNYFHYQVINGDDSNTGEFDGLNKILTGSDTEFTATTDLSGTVTAEKADAFLEELDGFISELDGRPSVLLGNTKLINKIKAVARKSGYLTSSEDAFGRTVDGYNGIPLVDLGYYYDGDAEETVSVIPTVAGLTDLYAVRLGLDGFHAATPQGGVGIETHLPDFTEAKAVHNGDVEMVAGVVLKNSRAAGVLRNIRIAGTVTS